MKFYFSLILLIIISVVIPSENLIHNEKPQFTFDKLFPLTQEDLKWVDSTFNSLSLRRKCSQLIVPYVNGKDTNDNNKQYYRVKKLVEEEGVGGILFLGGDLENQIAITNELQKKSNIPLLISSDYERGVGMRIEEAVEFPYKMAFAAAGNPNNDFRMAKVTAEEAKALGVHQNYAPLVDVVHDYRNPIINVRAYSSNPDVISIHSDAFIRGLHEGKVIATAKHFPGHGATDVDSHNELPLIELTEKDLWNVDLKTFQFAIDAGVQSVMIGHLDVPELTEVNGVPATFSYKVVTSLLKNKMGFDGLVVTDALNMHALTNNYTQKQIGMLSIQAGCDLLLFPAEEVEMLDGLVEAVESGRLPLERIDESVKKVLKVKKWLGLDKRQHVDINKAKKNLNNKPPYRLAQDIAEASVTLVKDEQNLIPVDPGKYAKIFSIVISDSRYSKTIEEPFLFEEKMNEQFGYVKNYRINFRTKDKLYEKILEDLKTADLIILPIYANVRSFQGSVELHEEQFKFIQQILNLNKPTIGISFGNPFILTEVPNISTYITTYGNVPLSQTAALDAILGNTKISGKLPINLPNTDYKSGDGIQKESKGLFIENLRVDTNYSFTKVDSLMEHALEEKVFPGASLLVGHRGRVVYHKNFGAGTYENNAKPIDDNSIFDLASLTKVVGTTSAAMLLYDKGELDLNTKVKDYLPQFGNNGKDEIVVKNLLLHNSGLPAWKPFYKDYQTSEEVIDAIMNMDLEFKPGTKYQYSDLGMIVLQKVIEKITGEGIDKFLKENFFDKLGMKHTFYNPSPKYWFNCVPTEQDDYWRHQTLKGKVHDETAYLLGGVAGHAGLFSTAGDLSKLMYLYVNKGNSGKEQIFQKGTIELFTRTDSDQSTRALGWDTKSEGKSSAGNLFSENSFGHTGFTGTSIWVDKDRGLFVILLTNRVQPTRENRQIIKFRPIIHDAIFKAVTE